MKVSINRLYQIRQGFGASLQSGVMIALAFVYVFCSSFGMKAQRAGSVPNAIQEGSRLLELGQTVKRELAVNATHKYGLIALAGQFAHVTVNQESTGLGIEVELIGPDGRDLHQSFTRMPRFPIYLIASISGRYLLTVKGPGPPDQKSAEPYGVQLDELRDASDEDRLRFKASQLLDEANGQLLQEALPGGTSSGETLQQAVAKYQEAISLYRSAGDQNGEAFALMSLAQGLPLSISEYERAIESWRQARAVWHSLHDLRMEAWTLGKLGESQGEFGQSQEKELSYRQALELWETLKDRRGQDDALMGIADALAEQGYIQEALNEYRQVLSACRTDSSCPPDKQLDLLWNLGDFYGVMGDYQREIDYLDQALRLARATRNRLYESNMLQLIGATHQAAGENEKALTCFRNALAVAREAGLRRGELFIMNRLGNFYVSQGEYSKALGYFERNLAANREDKSPLSGGGQAVALTGIGVVYHRQGELKKALESLEQALPLWPYKVGIRSTILQELASVHRDLGEIPRALEYDNQVLKESRAGKHAEAEAFALCDIARDKRAAGDLLGARRDMEAGLDLFESLRLRIAGSELRATYFARAQKNYEFYIDLLMQMHSTYGDQGFAEAALQASERERARSLLDMLTEPGVDFVEGADRELKKQEYVLAQRLTARSKFQAQLLSGEHTEKQTELVARELQALTREYESIEAQIHAVSPRYAALTQPQPLDIRQIQEQVLDSDTLLLEYALGQDRSYLWAVTPSSFISFTLPKRADIEIVARRVRELLTVRGTRMKNESQQAREARIAHSKAEFPLAASHLSEMVLGPVAYLLGNKRLLLVNDGVLQYIPLAVLPMPGHGRSSTPLMAEHEIVTVPSASVVSVLRSEQSTRHVAPKSVAVLADPVFDKEDPRVTKPYHSFRVTATTPSPPISDELKRSWADLGSGDGQIPRLLFSRREAEAIMASAPRSESLKAVDFRASHVTATSSALAQYRIVHFATHAVLDDQNPALSGIILSLVDPHGQPQDGFLRLYEIYNLHLSADLVVLSACQTALGKEIKGEGVVGLTRGFFYAGAERIMASLWEVDDVATAELMSRFYQGMLKEGLRPAAALQKAEMGMWRQTRWKDPYYWGAFTLQGEWK
jgi:CHAT domain-containing protein/Tfp pilus assembly protein PilF